MEIIWRLDILLPKMCCNIENENMEFILLPSNLTVYSHVVVAIMIWPENAWTCVSIEETSIFPFPVHSFLPLFRSQALKFFLFGIFTHMKRPCTATTTTNPRNVATSSASTTKVQIFMVISSSMRRKWASITLYRRSEMGDTIHNIRGCSSTLIS